jgi:hypothetical protein
MELAEAAGPAGRFFLKSVPVGAGSASGFKVNGEMSSPGISQQLELSKGSAHEGLDLETTPAPPGDAA